MWGVILSPNRGGLLVFINNSQTVKAVPLALTIIQQHFIRDVHTKFGIPYLPQSPDIGENSDMGISDFRVSGQSLIKRNSHTLEPVRY